MADFTATLPDQTQGKRIIDPAPVYSPLEGVAQGVGGIFSAFASRDQQARQQTKFTEDQIKFAQDQSDRSAQNAAATGLARIFGPQSAQTPGAGIAFAGTDLSNLNTDAVGIPQDVKDQAKQIQTAQQGVQQGRVSGAGYQLAVSQLLTSVQQRYPESAGAIFSYLHSQGVDHYLTREADLQLKAEENRDSTIEAANNALYQKAVGDYGYTGHTYEEAVTYGAQMAAQEQQLKVLKSQSDLISAQDTHDAAQRASKLAAQAEHDKTSAVTINSYIDNIFRPSIDGITQAYAAAANDPKAAANLEANTLSLLTNSGATVKAHAAMLLDQMGVTDTAQRQAVLSHVDDLLSSVKDVFTGTSSQVAVNQRALESIKTQFGLDATRSYQVYSKLSSIFGQQAINAHLTGQAPLPLSPDQQKALTGEMSAIKIAPDSDSVQAHLMMMDDILSGRMKWQSVPANKAPAVVRGLVSAVQGNQQAILAGDKASIPKWSNAYGNMALAAATMQQGSSNIADISAASGILGDRKNIAVIESMMKDPNTSQQASELMQGYRATAAHLLSTGQNIGTNTDPTGIFRIDVNPTTGLFQVNASRKAYDTWAKAQKQSQTVFLPGLGPVNGSGAVPSFGDIVHNSDATLQAKVTALNLNVIGLANTAKYDGNVPKGLTDVQLQRFYSTGELPDGAQKPAPKSTQADPTSTLNDLINHLSDKLTALPTQVAQSDEFNARSGGAAELAVGPQVDQAASEYGIPASMLHTIFQHESGFNPTADAHKNFPDSHAVGLGQIQPGTAAALGWDIPGYDKKTHRYTPGPDGGPQAGDPRLNPLENARMAAKLLSQRIAAHNGDVLAALRDYQGKKQWSDAMETNLVNTWSRYH